MNISCTICSDLVGPTENLLSTKCGHLFHDNCLDEWIVRSKTCPQCRKEVTESCRFRVYPTMSDENTKEVINLQESLDDALKALEKSQMDKELLNEYVSTLDTRNDELTELKDQIELFKKQVQCLKMENAFLKQNAGNLNGELERQNVLHMELVVQNSRIKQHSQVKEKEMERLKKENEFLRKSLETLKN